MSILQDSVRAILKALGEDVFREGLQDTPARVERMYRQMLSGYTQSPEEILKTSFSAEGYDEMVCLRDIAFSSLCEHHLLPFTGTVSIGYIPGEKLVGISKLPRLVEAYTKRLQIQERLTNNLAEDLEKFLIPKGVIVVVRAHHMCMSVRGVVKNAEMVTSAVRGAFRKLETRQEFLSFA